MTIKMQERFVALVRQLAATTIPEDPAQIKWLLEKAISDALELKNRWDVLNR